MKVFALKGTNDKATVVTSGGESKLFSYDTEVAKYDEVNGKMTVNGVYSATSLRHIKKFLEMYGYKKMSKKEIIEEFNITENI